MSHYPIISFNKNSTQIFIQLGNLIRTDDYGTYYMAHHYIPKHIINELNPLAKFNYIVKKASKEHLKQYNNRLRSIIDEEKAMAKLAHPNIMELMYSLHTTHSVYLVYKADSQIFTLDDFLRNQKFLKEEIGKIIIRDVVQGVVALFKARESIFPILNLKMIILSEQEGRQGVYNAKIGMFNHVQSVSRKESDAMIQDFFSAPEANEFKPLTFQSSVWSIGAIFYNILTGALPFQGKTFDEIKKNMEIGKYKFVGSNASIEAIEFIQHCLQENPENRLNCSTISMGYLSSTVIPSEYGNEVVLSAKEMISLSKQI